MTSHEFDRVSFFGVGIPEEPDEDNIKPVLASLHIGAKVGSTGRVASATLPPKLCPATASTPPISPNSARRSSAQAAIVCGGAPGSERPCWRRSTSTTPHSGRRSFSLRATLRQLLPAP